MLKWFKPSVHEKPWDRLLAQELEAFRSTIEAGGSAKGGRSHLSAWNRLIRQARMEQEQAGNQHIIKLSEGHKRGMWMLLSITDMGIAMRNQRFDAGLVTFEEGGR